MISPVTNPLNFDDPRSNTEARAIFMHQAIGDGFVSQGGDLQLYALELRFALSDRLALLATKDGYVDFNPDSGLSDEEGLANIQVGAKYAFFMDDAKGQIAAAGLRFEPPTGSTDVFQGKGDGIAQAFLTGSFALDDYSTITSASGLRVPFSDEQSLLWDFDIHLDRRIGRFYPLLELNLVHVLDAGDRLPISDEGFDLINFGAAGSDGKTTVTGAVGARYRTGPDADIGIAYQFPLTSGAGSEFLEWRITCDLIYSFSLS